MKLYIAGGKGEHGRNCFCIDDGKNTFLLDAGIMANDKKFPYPDLSNDQITRLKVIFLSHSHADHTGALKWLYEKGFSGTVVATKETFNAIKDAGGFECKNKVYLTDWKNSPLSKKYCLQIEYGKSGHCIGSVWLLLNFYKQDKKVLYTGDYTEHTQFYKCNKIRSKYADLAIIDCAYGSNTKSYKDSCSELLTKIQTSLIEGKKVVLPVPKNGRALELLFLLKKNLNKKERRFFADDFLFDRLDNSIKKGSFIKAKSWFKKDIKKLSASIEPYTPYFQLKNQIVFISDPQLKNKDSLYLAEQLINEGADVLFTGTVEADTPAQKLLTYEQGEKVSYPVHQNAKNAAKLCNKNFFQKTIFFHSAEKPCGEREIEF